ncbi:hypothetical protein DBV05_g12452 [Lasiodiplodia theobromae]|uniref:Peptidase S8/S53 domain-containing protein n=1 Tax=Lasiodiplodia theobromae TaxID=45133 RepID=A0A5N5CU70_9PEZI|nr:hypothetical protein DBV05_g12452 [Lasiodiplodia theobromae]
MCEATPKTAFDKIVRMKDSDSNNSLHDALNKEDPSRIAPELIQKINNPDEVLCELNGKGLSPLHIAVEYQQCTPSQLGIVKALIERSNKVLEVNVPPTEPGQRSVYLHHEKTRREAERTSHVNLNVESRQKPGGSVNDREVLNPPKEPPHNNPIMRSSAAPHKTTSTETNLSYLAGKMPQGFENQDFYKFRRSSITKNIAFTDKGINEVGQLADAPGQTKAWISKHEDKKEKVTEPSANAIRDLLKLRFMCGQKNSEKIDSFLYGPNPEKEIQFIHPEGPNAKTSHQILEGMKPYLHFEDTLQYVKIPFLRAEKSVRTSSLKLSPRTSSKGRDDYLAVFKWLKDKGVKRIVDLEVDDYKEFFPGDEKAVPSHSDEAIEKALVGIEVLRSWTWRKPDLSSELIFRRAPEISQLTLHWSGNDAILRSWSEVEGLRKLQNLKKVVILAQQGLETRDRTEENLEQFKDRLNAGRHDSKIEVEPKFETHRPTSRSEKQVSLENRPKQQHEWLNVMDRFADFIQNVDVKDIPRLVDEPIRVALIDDGIDPTEKTLLGKVGGGRSFCKSDDMRTPFYVTSGWHGTIMASMICRVCPKAQLWVYKLEEGASEDSKRTITAESAAQAVEAAVNKKVDIISMSWTIEKTGDNQASLGKLKAAINKAVNQNILLFCAANDQISDDESYPGYITREQFKIGAATEFKKAWEGTGEIPVNYILPGKDVIMERPELDVPLDKCTKATGSSISTALAAGLAALILYCVKMAACHYAASNNQEGNPITFNDFQKLKNFNRMNEAISRIGLENRYIKVDKFFKFKDNPGVKSKEEKREMVNKIAGRLIMSQEPTF